MFKICLTRILLVTSALVWLVNHVSATTETVQTVPRNQGGSAKQRTNDNDEFNRCVNCTTISCNLPQDPSCRLSWLYKPASGTIAFKIRLKTPRSKEWIALGFNTVPQMIGTNVVTMLFSENSFEIFNGYVKYYNAPLVEQSPILGASLSSQGLESVVRFERRAYIESLHTTVPFDLVHKCQRIVFATGTCSDLAPRTRSRSMLGHLVTPTFSEHCYNMRENIDITSLTLPVSTVTPSQRPDSHERMQKSDVVHSYFAYLRQQLAARKKSKESALAAIASVKAMSVTTPSTDILSTIESKKTSTDRVTKTVTNNKTITTSQHRSRSTSTTRESTKPTTRSSSFKSVPTSTTSAETSTSIKIKQTKLTSVTSTTKQRKIPLKVKSTPETATSSPRTSLSLKSVESTEISVVANMTNNTNNLDIMLILASAVSAPVPAPASASAVVSSPTTVVTQPTSTSKTTLSSKSATSRSRPVDEQSRLVAFVQVLATNINKTHIAEQKPTVLTSVVQSYMSAKLTNNSLTNLTTIAQQTEEAPPDPLILIASSIVTKNHNEVIETQTPSTDILSTSSTLTSRTTKTTTVTTTVVSTDSIVVTNDRGSTSNLTQSDEKKEDITEETVLDKSTRPKHVSESSLPPVVNDHDTSVEVVSVEDVVPTTYTILITEITSPPGASSSTSEEPPFIDSSSLSLLPAPEMEFVVNMRIATAYNYHFNNSSSREYRALLLSINKYLLHTLQNKQLNGFSTVKIVNLQRVNESTCVRLILKYRPPNELTPHRQMFKSALATSDDLSRQILSALRATTKLDDDETLQVNKASVSVSPHLVPPINENERMRRANRHLITVLLPIAFGALLLVSSVIIVLSVFACIQKKRSYNFGYPPNFPKAADTYSIRL